MARVRIGEAAGARLEGLRLGPYVLEDYVDLD